MRWFLYRFRRSFLCLAFTLESNDCFVVKFRLVGGGLTLFCRVAVDLRRRGLGRCIFGLFLECDQRSYAMRSLVLLKVMMSFV